MVSVLQSIVNDIRFMFRDNITPVDHLLSDERFSLTQKQIIKKCRKLPSEDVELIANPEFSDLQMYLILQAAKDGLDISWLADPQLDLDQMAVIYCALADGVDVSFFVDPLWPHKKMDIVYQDLKRGIDVSWYIDYPPFVDNTDGHLNPVLYWIRKGLEKGLDISWMLIPDISDTQAKTILQILEGRGGKL